MQTILTDTHTHTQKHTRRNGQAHGAIGEILQICLKIQIHLIQNCNNFGVNMFKTFQRTDRILCLCLKTFYYVLSQFYGINVSCNWRTGLYNLLFYISVYCIHINNCAIHWRAKHVRGWGGCDEFVLSDTNWYFQSTKSYFQSTNLYLQVVICTSLHPRLFYCKFVLFKYKFIQLGTNLYLQGMKEPSSTRSVGLRLRLNVNAKDWRANVQFQVICVQDMQQLQ